MDFQESRVSGDQAFFSITAKWGKAGLPSSTLAISLTGKSNLLEFLFSELPFRIYTETVSERVPIQKRGKKNHS